jgi:arsenical resistance protein ArsH
MNPDLTDLPNIAPQSFATPDRAALRPEASTHKPRILLLYGSCANGPTAVS